MELIIGTGAAAHVTSVQHRDIFSFIIGRGSYIPAIYEQLQPELQTNNSIKIRSGYLVHHGGIAYVQPNTYDQVTIQNGTQGMQRYDLIVARYTLNPETEVETMSWVVIQGTPAASNPVVPDYTHGNMQDGDLVDDCPVVRIKLDGIQVTEVVPLLTTLNADLSTLGDSYTHSINSNFGLAFATTGPLTVNRKGSMVHMRLQINVQTAQSPAAKSYYSLPTNLIPAWARPAGRNYMDVTFTCRPAAAAYVGNGIIYFDNSTASLLFFPTATTLPAASAIAVEACWIV